MTKQDTQEYLYLLDPHDLREVLGRSDIRHYRVRTIRAGNYVYAEGYPIWKTNSESKRGARQGKTQTSAAQQAVNERNTQRRIEYLLENNFDGHCIDLTCTYEQAPSNCDQAQRDLVNMIDRLRRLFKRLKAGSIAADAIFKYLYVSEYAARDGRLVRVHHHIVCNIADRDAAERCWRAGRANADRLQPDRFGFVALAKYLTKAPRQKRRWACSRSCKEPIVTIADKKLSVSRAMRMAEDIDADKYEIMTKIYPNCEYLDCSVRTSEYVQGAYIYARMRRRS